jgi:flagellar hook assembly protein FlgD
VENLTITDIPDNSIQLPFGYHLYQNYPNPFNSHTTMKYYLPKPNQVKVEIYDVLGQKVKTLINQPQNSGMHQVVWNGRDENGNSVSSGVYIYNLTSGNYSASKKLLLLK